MGGDEVIGLFTVTGFWVPGIHSRPLSDVDPDIAPDLVPPGWDRSISALAKVVRGNGDVLVRIGKL